MKQMKKLVNILMIEDFQDDAELISFELDRGKIDHKITRIWEIDKLEDELQKLVWDLVLCDYYLPGFNGADAIRIIRKKRPDLPIILVSGMVGDEKAVEVMKLGARDYILKDNLNRLIPAVKREVYDFKLRQTHLNTEKALEIQTSLSQVFIDHIPASARLVEKKTYRVLSANNYALKHGTIPGKKCYEYNPGQKEPCPNCKLHDLGEGNRHINAESKENGDTYDEHWVNIDENLALHYTFNITERKQSEKELIQAKEEAEESDRLKSAFLSNMSHEIRTPMNAIIGFTQILKDNTITDDERNSYIEIIEQSGNNMLNLLTDIIEFSRLESGDYKLNNEEFQVEKYIEDLFDRFNNELKLKNEKDLQLSLSKPEGDQMVVLNQDKSCLTQILNSLFQNAKKFTNRGSIEIGFELIEKEIRFYVKDTGIGIEKEKQEIIFQRFRQVEEEKTRTYSGAGLGLAISNNILEIMGSKIWVESEYGTGSTFYFTLPVYRIDKTSHPEHAESSGEDHGQDTPLMLTGKIILIVEDEITNYLVLENFLQKYNPEILWAKNGETAIDIVHSRKDIDLILMDIRLPGIDGMQATRTIRQFNTNIPIIAQTAYALQEDIDRAFESGCDDLITKPINFELLIEKMQVFLCVSASLR